MVWLLVPMWLPVLMQLRLVPFAMGLVVLLPFLLLGDWFLWLVIRMMPTNRWLLVVMVLFTIYTGKQKAFAFALTGIKVRSRRRK